MRHLDLELWTSGQTQQISTVSDDVLGAGEHSHALKIKMSTIVPTMQDWGKIMSHNLPKLSTSVIRDGETGRHIQHNVLYIIRGKSPDTELY